MNVNLDTFDSERAITLRDVSLLAKLQFKGRRPSLQMVQRWANRKRGYRPIGEQGPNLVIPTIRTGRELLTMPEWVDVFVSECHRVRVEHTRKLVMPSSDVELEKRAVKSMARSGIH